MIETGKSNKLPRIMELKGEKDEKQGKDEKRIRKLLRKNPQKVSINSRLKVISIIGQRRVFYRQRIPDNSCT